ncbi:MAG: DegT/DnrJ/EryC1/StrS family aminotransferase [Bacteroidales bacterium]|nr:DegT/DnrJ/EryC1/StrS family aminotransferase [Bacteroidales bacterium]
MKIAFSPPYIDKDVLEEVQDTLQSGWITTGPKVKLLESETAKLASVKYALCVNSATSGLMLAMHWFGIGPGDEVIIPAYTYAATALAVIHLGAKPVMADVNPDFNINVDSVKKAITKFTKAIIPVDIAGLPCDYQELLDLISSPEIKSSFNPQNEEQMKLGRILLLSDAAHSLGAVYKNKPSASIADLSVFSFHAVKNVTTAEGGAICISLPKSFSESDVYAKMRLMTLNGQTKDAYSKSKVGGWRYDIVLLGFKMNMPDVCAALGLAQIRKYKDQLLIERKRVAMQYLDRLRQYSWAITPTLKNQDKESSYHVFALRIAGFTENQRDRLIEKISKKDVSVNVHFIPLPMLKYFSDSGYRIDDYPNAYNCYKGEISLPIYPQMTSEMVDFVVKTLADSYNNVSCI